MSRRATGLSIVRLNNFTIKPYKASVVLATNSDTTAVWLTPGGVVLGAAILVSTAIAGLDSADHHIKLWVSGTTNKYVDVANGAAATSIAKNKKGTFITDLAITNEASALILTLDGGADNTPSAGTVEVEITYMVQDNIANV